MREWVCRLLLLLVLASTVILRSEYRGTHDHIYCLRLRLPQPGGPGPHIYILQEQGGPVITPGTGFPFRRLLWLTGLRWRYLILSPHRIASTVLPNTSYNHFARTPWKTSSIVQNACLLVRYLSMYLLLLSACVAGMYLPTLCLAMGIQVTVCTQLWTAFFIFHISIRTSRHPDKL
jgi:hypothetical protein